MFFEDCKFFCEKESLHNYFKLNSLNPKKTENAKKLVV